MWLLPASSFNCKLHGGTDCVCSLSHLQHQADCIGDARSTETRPTVDSLSCSLQSLSTIACPLFLFVLRNFICDLTNVQSNFYFSPKCAEMFHFHDLAMLLPWFAMSFLYILPCLETTSLGGHSWSAPPSFYTPKMLAVIWTSPALTLSLLRTWALTTIHEFIAS